MLIIAAMIAAMTEVLTGCSTTPRASGETPYWVQPEAAQPSSAVGSLLLYYGYVQGLNPTQSQQERERQRLAWADDASDFRRLQYAIALAGPMAGAADRRLSVQLLEPLAAQSQGRDAELHLLAVVLARNAELGRRAQAAAQLERRLESTTRELDRKSQATTQLQRQLDATTAELDHDRQAIKEMERKLEAMKNIERRLLQRSRAPVKEAKP